MTVFDHARSADRILHTIDPDALDVRDRIALAAAHAALASADIREVAVLVALLAHADDLPPIAKQIILSRIRRRLAIVPPETNDGSSAAGGNGGT